MKNIKCVFVIVSLAVLSLNSIYAQTAKVNITIVNFPWVLIEPYSYFKSDKEIKVEKIGQGNFILSYFGHQPKSFFINFREVLITPGDSVNIIYNCLDNNPDSFKDIIIANGSNKGNYIVSSLIGRRMPESSYPDYKQPKYLNNIKLFCGTLEANFAAYHKSIADTLKINNCNEEFAAYLLRTSNLKFLTSLYYLNDNLKNYPNQRKELINIIDSTFINTNFVKSDTAYSHFMEIAFNNYFTKMVIPRFNNIEMESDYNALIKYIETFPNSFIREYFVYFLATEYKLKTEKYKSGDYDKLISVNPHIGKERNRIMDGKNVYLR